MGNPRNPNGAGLKLKDIVYYSEWDNSMDELTAEERAAFESAGRPDLGYYGKMSLKDVVNDFHTFYVGEGKLFVNAKMRDVEWAAQKALRDLSYNTSRTTSAIEVELNQANIIPFPQDAVKIRKVSYTPPEGGGDLLELSPTRRIRPAKPILQEEQDFEYQYKENGDLIIGEKTESIERFQSYNPLTDIRRNPLNQYLAGYGGYDSEGYGNSRFNTRYGANTEDLQINGSYIVDYDFGRVYFTSQFQPGDIMTLEYVSDGLKNAGNFENVLVDKFDEKALHSCIKVYLAYNFNREMLPQLKRDKAWDVREAKIMAADFSPNEWKRLFRGINKWIKH